MLIPNPQNPYVIRQRTDDHNFKLPQWTLVCSHIPICRLDAQTVLQLGVGGGVKAGCNVWRALRNIEGPRALHNTWKHLGGRPVTGE